MEQRLISDFANEDVWMPGLTVEFVGGAPTDEALRAIHRCIKRARLTTPVTVRVRWAEPETTLRSLRIICADGEQLCASGPALLPALHKLCEHAISLQYASQEDRMRWRQAMERNNRHSSGVYAAV